MDVIGRLCAFIQIIQDHHQADQVVTCHTNGQVFLTIHQFCPTINKLQCNSSYGKANQQKDIDQTVDSFILSAAFNFIFTSNFTLLLLGMKPKFHYLPQHQKQHHEEGSTLVMLLRLPTLLIDHEPKPSILNGAFKLITGLLHAQGGKVH